MGFFHEFPHTSYYDRDLGWLIKVVKDLDGAYSELVEKVNFLYEQYSTIDDKVKEAVDKQMTIIRAEIDALIERINNLLAIINEKQIEIERELGKIKEEIILLNQTMLQIRLELYAAMDAKDDALKKEIYDYIKNIGDTWPPVIDPSDGFLEDINTALAHMYNIFGDGITAEEFDTSKITALEFDKLEITAKEFDTSGRKYLLRYSDVHNMFSPFTGLFVPVQTVIMELAGLHMLGVTAQEFDDTEFTAEEFDAKNLVAYDFDWKRDWLVKAG